jgi:thioglycine synthase
MTWSTAPTTLGTRAENRKVVAQGTHRVATLEDTLVRVGAKAAVMGVTRVSDITGLDVLGLPTVAAICPMINWPPRDGCISVMSGKGITREHARASALMEAAERWSARNRGDHTIRGSVRQLQQRFNVAHPACFVVPRTYEITDDTEIEWVAARSLVHHDVVLVPAFLVYVPYEPTDADLPAMGSSSNGLASGNTLAEATVHALYELIERDAEAIALHTSEVRRLDLAGVADDPELGPLVERFTANGIRLLVKEISQDIPVPTFFALTVDLSLRRVEYVNGGKGTHLDPRVALSRAITEVAQSRAVMMAGIREDMVIQRSEISENDFDRLLLTQPQWYQHDPAAEHVGIDAFADRSTDSMLDDLVRLVDLVRDSGLPDVLVVDLTRAELGIPVARVLVPGLEFHTPGNWCGPRLAALLERTPA